MTIEAIHSIKPGQELGTITYRPAINPQHKQDLCEILEGELPDGVASDKVHAFIAREPDHGFEQLAVVVEELGEDHFEVDFDPRDTEAVADHKLVRGVIDIALSESGAHGEITSKICPLPGAVLEKIGFEPLEDGGYILRSAA